MRCNLDVSKAKKKTSGNLRCNATSIIRPKLLFSSTFSLSASLRVSASIGNFRSNRSPSQQQFSDSLFGRSPSEPEPTDGRIRANGYLAYLDTKKYQVSEGEAFISVDSEASTIFIENNPDTRIINVTNPEFKTLSLISRVSGSANVRASIALDNVGFRCRALGLSNAKLNPKPHKISGKYKSVKDFQATQSLYPIRDIAVSGFANKELQTNSLYSNIDDGVLEGDYNVNNGSTVLLSDDDSSYIQANTKRVGIDYHLEFEVTPPNITPKNNFFVMRAAAPVLTRETDVTPIYQVKNIIFTDPSGNRIAKYKDLDIVGDADFYADRVENYTTYISEPEENYAKLHTWDSGYYPLFQEASGYKLSFDISAKCVATPFNSAFNFGYENECKLEGIEAGSDDYLSLDGGPLSTQYQDFEISPENSLRISALEIACRANSNSASGYIADNYFPLFLETSLTGNLVTRFIYPTQVLSYDTDYQAAPNINSVWRSSPDIEGGIAYNTSVSGNKIVTSRLTDYTTFGYITLDTPASGKLSLKFEHKKPLVFLEQKGGAFSFGRRLGAFSKSRLESVEGFDGIFTVRDVELRITAKKSEASVPDFYFDVMGWSDDRIQYVTSKEKAFLQNKTTDNANLLSSGYFNNDHLGISNKSISNYDNYEETFYNAGNDHSVLSSGALVTSTEFQTYTVPLKIYNDTSILQPENYDFSNFFESLYLDIYPLPSGASIARVELVVKHGPASAMPLHVIGFNETNELATRGYRLLPSTNHINQDPINKYVAGNKLSEILNIPQSFSSDATLKTNYSRRWKAVDGIYRESPFNSYEFDFSFEVNPKDGPFSLGLYDFNNLDTVTNTVFSLDSLNSGVFSSNLESSLINNLGMRFNSTSLFGHATSHKTIDWTQSGNELYGKIFDAFDNAIRVSGVDGHITFSDITTSGGFAVFTRFSPDENISGVSYNLFNSGVIVSKWDSGKDLEFTLGYNNGYLQAIARDESDNYITVIDTLPYSGYQYPLSVLLTYNDNNSQKLKLYTDNELSSWNFNRLRATSSSFVMASGDSDIVVGYSHGSGVGYNGFITSLGFSDNVVSGVNIVESSPSRNLLQSSADTFLDTFHVPLSSGRRQTENDTFAFSSFVNNITDNWHLGEFKYCQFNYEFNIMSKRDGENYIVHRFKTDGETYADRTDVALPSNVYASGLSYHTQLENDMLRLPISNTDGRLYSPMIRVSKNIPRGYTFRTDALYVETIMQHETDNEIIWEDGSVGPRIIVSLYSTNKNPFSFDGKNEGLLSRKIHHIASDECLFKLESGFDQESFLDDTSEPWSNFNPENIDREFTHYWNSDDIDHMFVQYDLAYPSGDFESSITIHTVNIRLKDALCYPADINSSLYLSSSGNTVPYQSMPLSLPSVFESVSASGFNLYASGYIVPISSGNLNLYSSGVYFNSQSLNLYGVDAYESTAPQGFGAFGPEINPYHAYSVPLYLLGRDKFSETNMALYTEADPVPKSFATLVLHTLFPYYTDNNFLYFSVEGEESQPTFASASGACSLYVRSPIPEFYEVSGSINLTVKCDEPVDPNVVFISDAVNLTVENFSDILSLASGLESFTWNSNNVGSPITLEENIYASVPLTDNIRGVQTICFGSCDSNGCNQPDMVSHDTVWVTGYCLDGGVARAATTYSNISDGYENNYYGIRKFSGLIPNSPYLITIAATLGTSGILEGPKELIDWEYGTRDDVNFSGVKIVQNDDYRQSGNLFGKDMVVKNDLMAIGAPGQNLLDSNGYTCVNAGSVFVYKRNPEPSGYNWTSQGHKSGWTLDSVLNLPEEFRRDYYKTSQRRAEETDFYYTDTFWYLGQNGRELGYSVDMARTPTKDIIVAGAPGGIFDRTFTPITYEEFRVCLMIITDEIEITASSGPMWIFNNKLNELFNSYVDIDKYKYFATPAVNFTIDLLIIQPVIGTNISNTVSIPAINRDRMHNFEINRHFVFDKTTQDYKNKNNLILADLKNAFHSVYPYDATKNQNNIPIMVGISVDESRSLGSRAIDEALNDFMQYYREYSYASGILNTSDVPATGHIYREAAGEESFLIKSVNLCDTLFDSGRLVSEGIEGLFADNLGQFNDSLDEFNYPPASGGAVYIFERPSGETEWRLTQEIKSPEKFSDKPVDRFGHDVAISDDGKVVVIGSPYSSTSIQIYESKDYTDRVSNLTASGSYQFYIDNTADTFKPYGLIYSYTTIDSTYQSHSSFTYNWSFLYDKFIPNARLGYSVDVNEDGSLVVAGAPTDSLGAFDSANRWYVPSSSPSGYWPNYVNAGAARVFQSRNYYPHNKVVEFGRFGNKHRSLMPDTTESDVYDIYFENSFGGREFIRTAFSETEIPQDAGLLFITTPEIDAANDEIIKNIQDWLALGDRHLVLVADDPSWEAGGVYYESNKVINKILRKLDSRMIIQPAADKSLTLSGDVDLTNHNVSASYNPYIGNNNKSTTWTSSVPAIPLIGSGVASIKLYYPQIDYIFSQNYKYNCFDQDYTDYNSKCNMPIQHLGDLRAEFNDYRKERDNGDPPKQPTIDKRNIGTYFLSTDWGRQIWEEDRGGSANEDPPTYQYEPIPVLTIAARTPDQIRIIPAIPDSSGYITRTQRVKIGSELSFYKDLGSSVIEEDEPHFLWSSQSGKYNTLDLEYLKSDSASAFFDPLEYNGTDAVLQAKAEALFSTTESDIEITDKFNVACEEAYSNTDSKVILISTQYTESNRVLFQGLDASLNFYGNIVAFNKDGGARIAQIGGFTGRTSLADANKITTSVVKDNLKILGNTVTENVSTYDLANSATTYNVAWIANANSEPSADEINHIKSWLAAGNRKLIITYGGDGFADFRQDNAIQNLSSYIHNANVATNICQSLSLSMRPLFLESRNQYAAYLGTINQEYREEWYQGFDYSPFTIGGLLINQSNTKYALGYNPPISSINQLVGVQQGVPIIPINPNNATSIASFSHPVNDTGYTQEGYLRIKSGTIKLSFGVTQGEAYRIFFDYVSESLQERYPINAYVSNCAKGPFDQQIRDYNSGYTTVSVKDTYDNISDYTVVRFGDSVDIGDASNFDPTVGRRRQKHIDVYVPTSGELGFVPASSIDIYFDASLSPTFTIEKPDTFRTYRLISVSGARLPVNEIPVTNSLYKYINVFEPYFISGVPEQQIVISGTYTGYQSGSDKYCPEDSCVDLAYQPPRQMDDAEFLSALSLIGAVTTTPPPRAKHYNDELIQDGPVVVAQEIYHQGSFDSGYEKSRITVIADASMIQGKAAFYSRGPNSNAARFLRSLYPSTQFSNDTSGRQYDNIYKVVSPERTSPHKLINYAGNSGIISKFVGSNLSVDSNTYQPREPDKYSSFTLYPKITTITDKSLSNFTDLEHTLNPNFYGGTMLAPNVGKPPKFLIPEGALGSVKEQEEAEIDEIQRFITSVASTNGYSKFAYEYNGQFYTDSSVFGGVPQIMVDTGYDHIDLEHLILHSGFPGDLFGYSVKIKDGNIFIGSPFAPFESQDLIIWDDAANNTSTGQPISGVSINTYGGAGAVYKFEKDTALNPDYYVANPWGCSNKFRPDTINCGSGETVGDMFGFRVGIDGSILAISAPGHDHDVIFERNYNSGEFVNKEFSPQFDIALNRKVDLGSSGNRALYGSGEIFSNAGAVFTFEDKFDPTTREKDWTFTQKIVAQGYQARAENEFFGRSLDIDRMYRKDADYTMLAGGYNHNYGVSGAATVLENAGCIYIFDAMLRLPQASFAHPDTFIAGKVVGASGYNETEFSFANNNEYDAIKVKYGSVYSNSDGEIFVEVSGQDKINNGFIVHRPYISSIKGAYDFGIYVNQDIPLYIEGAWKPTSGNMNLFAQAFEANTVYNNVNLYNFGISGVVYDELNMSVSGIVSEYSAIASGVNLFLDAGSAGISNNITMFVRGF